MLCSFYRWFRGNKQKKQNKQIKKKLLYERLIPALILVPLCILILMLLSSCASNKKTQPVFHQVTVSDIESKQGMVNDAPNYIYQVYKKNNRNVQ
jgi:hypothetical protein